MWIYFFCIVFLSFVLSPRPWSLVGTGLGTLVALFFFFSFVSVHELDKFFVKYWARYLEHLPES